jgi:uncharacterized protein YggE
MFRSRCRALHLALIPMLSAFTLMPAWADEPHRKEEKTSGSTILHPYRLPISRMGYSNAKPDKATVEVPTLVEGETWEIMQEKQAALSGALQAIVKPFDPTGYTVPGFDGHSDQAYHGDKKFPTMVGRFSVTVRDLTHLAEVIPQIEKFGTGPVQLKYHIGDSFINAKAWRLAQLNAITEAKSSAEWLAAAVGTKIVGVLEIREGEVKAFDPTYGEYSKDKPLVIPSEIQAYYARINIVYELAPSTRRRSATPLPRKKSPPVNGKAKAGTSIK